MRVACLSPASFEHTGIQTVEKNLVQALENDLEIELERVNPFWTEKDFPFSTTLDSFMRHRVVGGRIPEDVDKVFVPSQTRMCFDPEEVDAEVIVYVHDLFPTTHFFKFVENRSWLYENLFYHVGQMVSTLTTRKLMKADKILTPSRYVKEDVETHTPFSGDVSVVGQGVDNLPRVEQQDRDIDLLYVGGTLGRKNPEFLQEALSRAEAKGFRVATVNYSELDLPGDTFTDVSDKGLARLYSRSRFYLHPSYVEGFGRGPVEAQRYGCIPLALDKRINCEVLGAKRVAWLPVSNTEDVVGVLERFESEAMREVVERRAEKHTWSKARKRFLEAVKQ